MCPRLAYSAEASAEYIGTSRGMMTGRGVRDRGRNALFAKRQVFARGPHANRGFCNSALSPGPRTPRRLRVYTRIYVGVHGSGMTVARRA